MRAENEEFSIRGTVLWLSGNSGENEVELDHKICYFETVEPLPMGARSRIPQKRLTK